MGTLVAHRAKLALALIVAAALGGGWLWLRDSSLFSVDRVQISGLRGDTAPAIRSSLEQAAHSMSTLHVQVGKLRAAVAAFTVVKDLRVQSHFPHSLSISVVEQLPVAALDIGGHRVPLAANGTVVSGMAAPANVPTLPSDRLPARSRVTDHATLVSLAVIGAAPRALRDHVATVGSGALGLTVQLRQGPLLYFGDATLLHAKWLAAAKILADPGAHGATYIDLRIPSQPTAQVGDAVTSGAAAQGPGVNGGQAAPGSASPAPATAGVATTASAGPAGSRYPQSAGAGGAASAARAAP